jgi:uncharacterized integral membrane protein (TIGR00697 family)
MITSFTDWLIAALHNFSFIGLSLLLVLVAFLTILFLMRFWGKMGLMVYMVVAVIVANIQVLKAVETGFTEYPVALGTMLFATTYLVVDILAEYFGRRTAQLAIVMGFVAYFLFNVFMLLTLGYKPLDIRPGMEEWAWAAKNHEYMYFLFSPAPRFFVASVVAYFAGQYLNVAIFFIMRKALRSEKWLWFRNFTATALGMLSDELIFSGLAWFVLASTPLSWEVIFFTYIIGSYATRIVMALLSVPVIYWARNFLPLRDEEACIDG